MVKKSWLEKEFGKKVVMSVELEVVNENANEKSSKGFVR